MTHPDKEPPEADVAEQAALANPVDANDDNTLESVQAGLEVSEWDAVEQSIVVPLDDEPTP